MKASYALGLFFIVSVSIIWSAASILVQYLYQGLDFDSPFLLTYIGTSLLTILIPIFILTNEESGLHELLNYFCCYCSRVGTIGSMGTQTETRQDDEATNVETVTHSRPPPSSSFMKLSTSSSSERTSLSKYADGDYRNNNSESQGQQQDETFNYDKDEDIVSSSPERSQRQHLNQQDKNNNDDDEEEKEDDDYGVYNNNASIDGEGNDHYYYEYYHSNLLSHRDHIEMAMKVAPFWFISNYFYNLSLQYTTITSSTVLSSTASVFTFLFALKWGDETFNKWKLFGVIMAFCGSFATSLHDVGNDDDDDDDINKPLKTQLWGDVAGLISAFGYGVYTVLLRNLCNDESRVSMNLFLGYIGVWNSVLLSPLLIWYFIHDTDNSHLSNKLEIVSANQQNEYDISHRFLTSQKLTWFVFFCLVVKGLFDNVLSDYLWARGIVLTSATVATVGLGLTIPLALLSDLFVMKRPEVWNFESVLGALLVLLGFIFVNIGEDDKREDIEDPLDDFDEDLDQVSFS